MRVWIVEIGEQISGIDGDVRDWRCGILAKTLAAKGHQVVLWASTFDHITKRHRFKSAQKCDLAPGLQVQFLHGPGYANNISMTRVLHHWVTARSFSREAATLPEPDLLFCSLPTIELAEQSIRYAQRRKIPVTIDIADLWPDIYLNVFPLWLRRTARMALAWEFQRVGRILRGANGLTGVSDSYLAWGLAHAGRSKGETDGVFPLGYALPDLATPQIEARASELRERLGLRTDALILTFTGSFGASYDLETVVAAGKELFSRGQSNVQYVLAGDGDKRGSLQLQAGTHSQVIFAGWLDRTSVVALLSISSVGLVTYTDTALQSLPNKPFEYMAAGLPLLSSLQGDLETMIGTDRIGLHYRAGDVQSLVEKTIWLAEHQEERVAMGQRARKLFEERFRAEIIYPRFMAHLEQVAANATR